MSDLVFPLILLGGLLIFAAIAMIVLNRQKSRSSIEKKEDNIKKSNKTSSNNATKDVPKEDVFKFMEFDKILNNMIVQENGTKFTMAVKCKGINYDLMSDIEQIAVEEGFITFLNTLRYPIQLYVQAQNIDLKAAISTYKQNASGLKDEYEEINRTYNNLIEQFDSDPEEIKKAEEKRERVLNVYEYADDIINYVEKLSLNKSLLQRNFYVLVSYHTTEITSASNFTKEELVNICYNELLTRAQTIISALASCSVAGEVLNSNELADLLYMAYNRDDKGFLSVREAIQSGFYRLYSTSEDVFMKKQEKLQEQINVEAQYRALDAMREAIKKGEYISPEAEQLDVLDRVNKQAAEIVASEELPSEVKDKAKKILVDEYRKEKKEILKKSNDLEEKKEENTDKEEKKSEESAKTPVNDDKKSTSTDDSSELLDNRMEFTEEEKKGKNNTSEESENTEDDLII